MPGTEALDLFSHSLIYNSLKAVHLDETFSPQCKAFLTKLSCRYCHYQLACTVLPTTAAGAVNLITNAPFSLMVSGPMIRD